MRKAAITKKCTISDILGNKPFFNKKEGESLIASAVQWKTVTPMVKTIILIDDDQDDLDIMKEAIMEIEKSILSISFLNPVEALQAIENELIVTPDFVFLDINMSPFTGDKCLKELRMNPELQNHENCNVFDVHTQDSCTGPY